MFSLKTKVETARVNVDNYKIFFDTEFYENGEVIVPISFGALKGVEGNNTIYLINKDFDYDWMVADATKRGRLETIEFLDNNVFNNLGEGVTISAKGWGSTLLEWLTPNDSKMNYNHPFEFWASTASYDWVLLSQLFGAMVDLPKGFPHCPMDTAILKRLLIHAGKPDLSGLRNIKNVTEHNALYDAYEVRLKYLHYRKYSEDNNLPVLI